MKMRSGTSVLIGTGGIGSGRLFQLDGMHTIGREESRSGTFLGSRDYCKLHIIAHYARAMIPAEIPVFPIGRVGDDREGRKILDEMDDSGLDTRYVQRMPNMPTLYSICFLYPDGTGGNLTESRSASSAVNEADIEAAAPVIQAYSGRGTVLAAPEVPLTARKRILLLGKRHHFLCAASFTSAELRHIDLSDFLPLVDILSINLDEAAAVAGWTASSDRSGDLVARAVEIISSHHPAIKIAVTAGKEGSWSWSEGRLQHTPAVGVEVESSAGAGDAYLAALIAGAAAGASFHHSQVLAAAAAAYSTTSPHTIHPDFSAQTLLDFIRTQRIPVEPGLPAFLQQACHSIPGK